MDRERDDSMSDMLAIIPPCSIQVNQQNPRLQALKAGNFGSFLEKEHNLFEEMIGEGDISNNLTGYINISQLGISNSKPLHPMVTSSTSNALPLKRTLPSVYWTDGGGSCSPSSSAAKRFHVDASGGSTVKPPMDENSSIASLLSSLSQLPQTPSLHQETVMGPLGDGIFRCKSLESACSWRCGVMIDESLDDKLKEDDEFVDDYLESSLAFSGNTL
ncbi:hypothetical protein U1Q18_000618 [Sarracenia purpurea var. burkii]